MTQHTHVVNVLVAVVPQPAVAAVNHRATFTNKATVHIDSTETAHERLSMTINYKRSEACTINGHSIYACLGAITWATAKYGSNASRI